MKLRIGDAECRFPIGVKRVADFQLCIAMFPPLIVLIIVIRQFEVHAGAQRDFGFGAPAAFVSIYLFGHAGETGLLLLVIAAKSAGSAEQTEILEGHLSA